ncbi:m125R [Myxoma virus]|uniref:M125R n=2 Tax=Myxoma virus TaxID=10273 RepID=Q9Q8H6_MYXVL|nr:m125R [Myxoma virus]ACB28920.1 m125R [recombinant virus 6918VP60-T2]AAF15013.1 m125R [Myxoma virus]ACB28748.1 m125R [Myxoma virus]ADK63765.1 m125R [Myxoma virus]AFU77057.1 m125R [Myxoma virus]
MIVVAYMGLLFSFCSLSAYLLSVYKHQIKKCLHRPTKRTKCIRLNSITYSADDIVHQIPETVESDDEFDSEWSSDEDDGEVYENYTSKSENNFVARTDDDVAVDVLVETEDEPNWDPTIYDANTSNVYEIPDDGESFDDVQIDRNVSDKKYFTYFTETAVS